MCVGAWGRLGMIRTSDVMKVTKLEEVDDELEELPDDSEDGWDRIVITNTLT